MKNIYTIETGIDPTYYCSVEAIVRQNDSLLSSPSTIIDSYSLDEYIIRGRNATLNVLIDNNILTRLIDLAKGKEIECNDKSHRDCCALISFFMLGHFQLEPNIAIYERASKLGHLKALDDYQFFTIANHIHPMVYTEIALGLKSKVSYDQIDYTKSIIKVNEPKESNFCKGLNIWKLNYLYILKAVILLKSDHESDKKVEYFLDWVIRDCLAIAGSIIFTLCLFSPRKSKLPTMIKNINSTNKNKLLDGIKNTAWDLTYLAEWSKHCKNQDENTIWFLCSNDKLLKLIAENIFLKHDQEQQSATKALIYDYWSRHGDRVYETYLKFEEKISFDKSDRLVNTENFYPKLDNIIQNLEITLSSQLNG